MRRCLQFEIAHGLMLMTCWRACVIELLVFSAEERPFHNGQRRFVDSCYVGSAEEVLHAILTGRGRTSGLDIVGKDQAKKEKKPDLYA